MFKTKSQLIAVCGLTAGCVVFGDRAQAVTVVNSTWQSRVVTEPSGNRDDNNGGSSVSNLIGRNTGNVVNFLIYSFDVSALEVTDDVTVTFDVNDLNNAQGGSADDSIELYALFPTNTGLIKGTGEITGTDTPANDGSVTYANKNQYNGGGTTVPWKKADGSDAANLEEALVLIASIQAYDGPKVGAGTDPFTITFNVSQAVAQSWVDDGLTGLVLGATDGGGTGTTDDRARFFFSGSATGGEISVVPEPTSLALLALGGLALSRRRRA